jgi:5-formyltetrahydrofolate cyclo-ligase
MMTKAQLRAAARASRAVCDPAWGVRLAGHVLDSGLILPAARVAGFWPLPGEIDVRPLLLALVGRGHAVLLPQTPPRGQPLAFRHWRPGVRMLDGPFGTVHPDGPLGTPTLLLVPLLAFDARCNRLGYGGGYYDRTIAALPGIRSIGCGFATQQVDEVIVLPHDARLDAVATERGVILNPER